MTSAYDLVGPIFLGAFLAIVTVLTLMGKAKYLLVGPAMLFDSGPPAAWGKACGKWGKPRGKAWGKPHGKWGKPHGKWGKPHGKACGRRMHGKHGKVSWAKPLVKPQTKEYRRPMCDGSGCGCSMCAAGKCACSSGTCRCAPTAGPPRIESLDVAGPSPHGMQWQPNASPPAWLGADQNKDPAPLFAPGTFQRR